MHANQHETRTIARTTSTSTECSCDDRKQTVFVYVFFPKTKMSYYVEIGCACVRVAANRTHIRKRCKRKHAEPILPSSRLPAMRVQQGAHSRWGCDHWWQPSSTLWLHPARARGSTQTQLNEIETTRRQAGGSHTNCLHLRNFEKSVSSDGSGDEKTSYQIFVVEVCFALEKPDDFGEVSFRARANEFVLGHHWDPEKTFFNRRIRMHAYVRDAT